MAVDLGAGITDVGQHATGTKKNVVFYDHSCIHGNVVLDLDIVSDHDAAIDVDVLPDHALLADLGTLHHVRKMPDFRSGADCRSFIGIRGFMHKVRLLGLTLQCGNGFRCVAVLQGPLESIQHSEHSQSFLAIADGGGPRFDAIKEMLAFRTERLAIVERHNLPLRSYSGRDAVFPFDLMRIEHQFVLDGVVEHGHLLRAHHNQFLFLDWVQPADEDVCAHAAGKFEVTQCDVSDTAVQISAALAGNVRGHFIQQSQDHGDIVRGKTPEDVFFGADFADVEPVGVEIIDLSQMTVLNQLLQLEDRRVVTQDVANHENAAPGLRELHQLFAVLHVDR